MIRIECRGADLLPLDAIEDFQGKLKKRGKKEIDKIIKSIETYGFSFPFFVWNGTGHNYCLDGHGRIQALSEMRKRGVSLPLFPVAYIEAKDEAEAKQKLLRLNSQYGTMDMESVLEFTEGIEVEWDDLALPGGEVLAIGGDDPADQIEDAEPEIDKADELKKKWGVETGQLWQLGDHRLLCGNSTKAEDVERVMQGEKADAVVTDPPYGVGIQYATFKDTEKNTEQVVDGFMPHVLKMNVPTAITPGVPVMWEYPQPAWVMAWIHPAPIGGCAWGFNGMNPILVYGKDPYLSAGLGRRPDHIVMAADREGVDGHPTPKPIKVWLWLVERLTIKKGQVVYEPFNGSGTTIIACEQLGRKCRAIEISPGYVAVALQRWADATGKVPVLLREAYGEVTEDMAGKKSHAIRASHGQ